MSVDINIVVGDECDGWTVMIDYDGELVQIGRGRHDEAYGQPVADMIEQLLFHLNQDDIEVNVEEWY